MLGDAAEHVAQMGFGVEAVKLRGFNEPPFSRIGSFHITGSRGESPAALNTSPTVIAFHCRLPIGLYRRVGAAASQIA
jgi:hypothetical protein